MDRSVADRSPRVLVVSHNVFGDSTNMGKTLRSYFREFDPGKVAQFYIHPETPGDYSVCRSYFRITDREVLDSVLLRKERGTVFAEKDVPSKNRLRENAERIEEAVYRHGSRRGPLAYILRNALWKSGAWKTDRLREWVDDFRPEVVFFASGDYAFMYEVAVYLADYAGVPLVTCCVDDYYLYNRNQESVLGRVDYRAFMRTVHRAMRRSGTVFVICESMKGEYEKLFGRPSEVLHTSVDSLELELDPDASRVSYIGNLSLGRSESLIEMGRALRSIHLEGAPDVIDVYSGESDERITGELTAENGIRFHGRIDADEVLEVMRGSMAVVHVESFDESMRKRTRFSVSTKIAESLAYGPCLIAYGPEGIASIDYLADLNAAHVIASREGLPASLKEFFSDVHRREYLLANARAASSANHLVSVNSCRLAKSLRTVCDTGKEVA